MTRGDLLKAASDGGWSAGTFVLGPDHPHDLHFVKRVGLKTVRVFVYFLKPGVIDEMIMKSGRESHHFDHAATVVAFLNAGGSMTRNNFKGHGFRRFVEKGLPYDRFTFYGVDGQRNPVRVFASAGSTGLIWLHYASSGQRFMTIGTAQKFYAAPDESLVRA